MKTEISRLTINEEKWWLETDEYVECASCGTMYDKRRADLGYEACKDCGDFEAVQQRASWCVAPIHKSNYILITDPAQLAQLNPKRTT
jgi:hypothetical protein